MQIRRTQLHVERLEDRCTPANFGNPWPDAAHLTLSFAPDGTRVGEQTSELFRMLNAVAPTAVWQREVLRAVQTWAAYANINLSVVADSGLPLGTTGAPQGDARFGDLRLVAVPMPQGGEAGDAEPFESDAGTWTGDITLNSNAVFGIGSAEAYDLFTVLLHEAGHALGLDHNADPASVMYEAYLGPRTGLSSLDSAALQALYGARLPDRYEGNAGNNQINTATPLGVNGLLALSADADVTTLADRDVFSFTTLLGLGGAVVQVRTAGVSLLTPRVTVFDAAGKPITSAVAVDPLAGGLSIRLSNLRELSTYYVKIESGQQTAFGVGSYQLTVTSFPLLTSLLSSVTATVTYTVDDVTGVLFNNDLHTNDSFMTALNLQQTLAQPDARFDNAFRGSISDAGDVDFYRVTAPAAPAGTELVLTAMIWSVNNSVLNPRVRVFDANQNPVAAEVLNNDGANYVLQIHGAVPQATYFVEALPAAPSSTAVGNYFLGVDFGTRAIVMDTFATGALTAAQSTSDRTLHVYQRVRLHLVLAASAQGGVSGATVCMTITDSTGHVVFTLTAGTAEPVSGIVDLPRGTYSVRFVGSVAGSGPLPNLAFILRGNDLTRPIGPEATDPTGAPSGGSGDSSSPNYDWSGGSSSGLPPSDPANNPSSGSTSTGSGGSTTSSSNPPSSDDQTSGGSTSTP